jgi:hypothetical protein
MNYLWERFKAWFKRLPWLAGLAGVLLFGLVMGAIFKTDLRWWEYGLACFFGGLIAMASYSAGD